MKQSKFYSTFLFLLFFLAMVFLPTNAFAESNNLETKQDTAAVAEEKSSKNSTDSSSNLKEDVIESQDNNENKNSIEEKSKDIEVKDDSTDITEDKDTEAKDNSVDITEDKNTEAKDDSVDITEDKDTEAKDDFVDITEDKDTEAKDDSTDITEDKDTEAKDDSTDITEDKNTEAKDDSVDITEDKDTEAKDDSVDITEDKDTEAKDGITTLEEGKDITLYKSTLKNIPNSNQVEVDSYDKLVKAIEDANGTTTIIITKSFEITKTINIPYGKDIIITSAADRNKGNNKIDPIGKDKINLPKDSDSVEKRQDLVKEAEKKGEKALEDTDLEKNPLAEVDIVIQRAKDFLGTLFNIEKGGKLTLGKDNKDPIFIDGNKNVKTSQSASFVDVSGEFIMNGGFIANGYNEESYSAPINIRDGGKFIMNGGRITNNKNLAYARKPNGSWEGAYFAAGGVYINEGGQFILNAGSIDNNKAPVGGVFLGNFSSPSKSKSRATFIMNGGLIARNQMINSSGSSYTENYGGGVHVDSNAVFNFINGIIAGNESFRGGGIAINDNYVTGFDGANFSNTKDEKYEDYIEYAGSYFKQNGGLIYKNIAKKHHNPNTSGAGGGLYINSSTTEFNKGYIIKNKSENMGGGIYVSIAPHKLKLEHTLVTDNTATSSGSLFGYPSGFGGGYWNCPVGIVDLQDFNTLYIFGNHASGGKDIYTIRKNYYRINGKYVEFETTISPITGKGNIIRFVINGKEVPKKIYHTTDGVSLQAIYDELAKAEAWTNSSMFIIGNESLKGGGIGSNAHITAPGKTGDYEISIEKKWHESIPKDKIPESIWVDLFIGDKKYAEIELSEKNKWSAKFKNLPFTFDELKAKGLKYSIKEQSDDFYSLVEENISKQLEIERIWVQDIDPSDKYDKRPPHAFMKYKIVFVYKDKNGNEISRQNIAIENPEQDNKHWIGIAKNQLLNQITDLKDIKITYHSFNEPYIWDGFYGLDPDSSWYDNGPWHEAYVIDNGDGTIEIQLPYLWTQYRSNPYDRTDNYYENNSGYRLNSLSTNLGFTITNYPYSEIPIVKNWHESIKDSDIPDSVKVYLLKDGKRVKDENGNDRFVILSKENGWKASFERLPYFGIAGMEFDKYWIKEDSDIFIPLIKRKSDNTLDIEIERIALDDYLLQDDYTGGTSKVHYIPIELHYDGKVYKTNIKKYPEGAFVNFDLMGFFKNILINGNDIEIKTYYDENGDPFPRNLGEYEGHWANDPVTHFNPGSYIFKLVEENGKYVLYVPKLTASDTDENLFDINTNFTGSKDYFELTNYYLPKHRIEIEKIWEANDEGNIPDNLKITIKGKYGTKEITLTPENWKYFEEILGKGLLSNNNYEFSEEDLEKFNGKHSIDLSMEFSAENKEVTFLDSKGNKITKDEFNKLIKGKNYSFELVEAQDGKAEISIKYDEDGNLIIVYPVDVTITEVAHVVFTNTETPPETPPEVPPETPHEPHEPPETPPDMPPEIPPSTPPKEPLAPMEIVPAVEKPLEIVPAKTYSQRTPGQPPKTFDPGIDLYLALSGISIAALYALRKREDN